MTSILVKENDLLTVTTRTRIMQRSKLFQNLRFVVEPIYYGCDMANATVLLEYILPNGIYKSAILERDSALYNDFYVYTIPVDTDITEFAGKVEMQLSFYYVDLDEDGKPIQKVRKTTKTCIDIIPISAWSDIVPDETLTALDQRIIKTDSQIKALGDLLEASALTSVDNIAYNSETREFQLMAGDMPIGDRVVINNEVDEDGVPVVDLENLPPDYKPNVGENSNVVLF